MTKYPVALAITLALSVSVVLPGCDSTANLTEQEHIQRAKDFEDKGNLKGSIVELKNAIQKNTDSSQARLLLGQIYLKAGMGAEAEKELSQAEKLGVNPEIIKPQLGEALLLMGEYKRVLDDIQPSEQTSKINLARILQIRADAMLKQGMIKEGCSLFQQSLDAATNNPATYWGLAQCAVAERDMKQAKDWLDAALKTKDKQAKTLVFIGDWEQLNHHSEAALAAYTSALGFEPDNLEALRSRATLKLMQGQLEAARTDIEKIRKLAPKSLAANYLLALLNFKEKKYPESRDALQEALKIAPNNVPALLLGGSIENVLGNPQTAELHINKAVRLAPRNVFALRMLAATQLSLGRPDDAAQTIAPIDLEKVQDSGLLVVAGEIALAKNEYAKAASFFEKAAKLSPNNAPIRTELGMARLAQGDMRAMADLQAAADLGDSDTRANNFIILNQLKSRQFDAALVSIAALEKKQPQSPLPWNYRGAAYIGKKDIAKARNSFNQALKLDPKSFAAAANLAQLDFNEGQTKNARKHFERILDVAPAHLQAMLALADLSLREKDEKAYLNWLEKAIKAHPQSLLPREQVTRYLLTKGENNKALTAARDAVNAMPDDSAALNLLGKTQLAVGDSTNAIVTLGMLTKKAKQSPDAYLSLALAQIANKNLADARVTLQSALKIKPDHIQSQDALLRLELIEGKLEAALRIARQIQIQRPQSPIGFDREASIQLSLKHLPQAIKAYEEALSKGAGSTGFVKLFQTYNLAGNAGQAEKLLAGWLKQHPSDHAVRAHAASYYMANGQNKEAIAQYVEVQRYSSNNVVVLNNLAILYQREKDARALPTAEHALKLAPDNPMVQDTLGWILVEQGQVPRGLELLRKAVAKVPKAPTVRYHYAVALARSGNKPQARKVLESLLSDTLKFPEVDDAKVLLKGL